MPQQNKIILPKQFPLAWKYDDTQRQQDFKREY